MLQAHQAQRQQPDTSSNLSAEAQLQKEHLRLLRQAGKQQELALNAKLQASTMRDIQRRQHVALNSALGVYRPPSQPPLPIETVLQKWQYSWHQRVVMFQPPPLERIVFSPPAQPVQTVVPSSPPEPLATETPATKQDDEDFPSWLNYEEKPQLAEVLPVVEEVEDTDLTEPRLAAIKAASPIWEVPTNVIEASPVEQARLATLSQDGEPATHHVEVHGKHSTTEEIERLLDRTAQLYLDVFGCDPEYHALSSMEGLAIICAHGKRYRGRLVEIDKTLVSGAARAYGKAVFQPVEEAV